MWLAKQVWFLIHQVRCFSCCCCCCARYCNCHFSVEIHTSIHRLGRRASVLPMYVLHFCRVITTAWYKRRLNTIAFTRRFHLEKSPWKAFADNRWSWWESICLFLTFKLTKRIHSNRSWLHNVEEGAQAARQHPAAGRSWTALPNIFLPKPVGGQGRWWGPAWKAFRSVFMRNFHRLLKQLLRGAASTLMSLADATVKLLIPDPFLCVFVFCFFFAKSDGKFEGSLYIKQTIHKGNWLVRQSGWAKFQKFEIWTLQPRDGKTFWPVDHNASKNLTENNILWEK